MYLVKNSDASERTLQRRPLPVRLVIEPESPNFFKSMFKLLNVNPQQKSLRINVALQKSQIYINFLSKCELQPCLY